jgi:DNA-binding transcriptional regulator GbsR (MarR family)
VTFPENARPAGVGQERALTKEKIRLFLFLQKLELLVTLLDHPDAKAFILHWGEMGTHWGVNRSVAQVHALLYLSEKPVDAEAIVEALGLARSNVSTALKELQTYAIVRRVHVEGDRRDHFVAEGDLWEMLMRIVAERKRREIDPTIALLAELAERLRQDDAAPAHLRDRVVRMHEFLSTLGGWYEQVRTLPKSTLVTLMKLGSKVARFIPGGKAKD